MAEPRVVFFGSPVYAASTLESLVSAGILVVAVVTQPDRCVGRQGIKLATPVKLVAQRRQLNVYQPEQVEELVRPLLAFKPTVGVLLAYGKILPEVVLQIFPGGILNIHPSILPKYRGPSPVPQAILDGQKFTGVTIIQLDEQLDHGPIVTQVETPIGSDEKADELLVRLAEVGTRELIKILPRYLAGTITLVPQRHDQATYTKTLTRQDGEINWSKSAETIYRQYRACFPWPGVFTAWAGKRLKLDGLLPQPPLPGITAGTVVALESTVVVACGEGSIAIVSVQLEGKAVLPMADFLHGYSKFVGATLG